MACLTCHNKGLKKSATSQYANGGSKRGHNAKAVPLRAVAARARFAACGTLPRAARGRVQRARRHGEAVRELEQGGRRRMRHSYRCLVFVTEFLSEVFSAFLPSARLWCNVVGDSDIMW